MWPIFGRITNGMSVIDLGPRIASRAFSALGTPLEVSQRALPDPLEKHKAAGQRPYNFTRLCTIVWGRRPPAILRKCGTSA